MNKAILVGGLAVILGASYGLGVVVTGNKVNEQYQRYVEVLTENYHGVAKVTSTANASFLSSSNALSLEFFDLPEPVMLWAGGNTFNFNISFKHGFLYSDSVVSIAKGDFLKKLKSYQVNADVEPIVITSEYRYDLSAGSILVNGNVVSDAFKVKVEQGDIEIGSSQGPFTVAAKSIMFDWVAKPSKFVNKDLTVDFGRLTLSQTAEVVKGDILTAKLAQSSLASISIDSIAVQGLKARIDIDKLLLDFKQNLKNDRVLLDIIYSASSLKIDDSNTPIKLDKPEIQLGFNLDTAALLGFVKSLKETQHANQNQGPSPETLIPLLSQITQKGVSFNINKLAVSVSGETLVADANLTMAPFSIEEVMLDMQGVSAKADLAVTLKVPKQFLEAFPGMDPQEMGFFVGMGYLVDAGENYSLNLVANKGKVKLNGEIVPFF